MSNEEIFEELQEALKGLEMNMVFLRLFSLKEESLGREYSPQAINGCKSNLLNSAKQYTYDYLPRLKLCWANKSHF